MNLDEEIVVEWNGSEVFRGKVERKVGVIFESLKDRLDVGTVATGVLEVGNQ